MVDAIEDPCHPSIPPSDNPLVCKVCMIFQRDQRFSQNVFYCKSESGWTLSSMGDLALAANNWWANFYKLAMPNVVSLVQVQVRLLDPGHPFAVDYPVSPPIPGTRGTSVNPANVTSTLSWRTGLAGRRFRGRNYVPGLLESDVDDTDRLGSVIVGLLANAAYQFVHASFSGSPPVVFHKPTATPSPFDNLTTAITSYVIENIVDSQRRRLPLRGR